MIVLKLKKSILIFAFAFQVYLIFGPVVVVEDLNYFNYFKFGVTFLNWDQRVNPVLFKNKKK